MTRRYGFSDAGVQIQAPAGWQILAQGQPVPSAHREAKEDGTWCSPRRGRSTMTPIHADVWGYVRAIAVPTA